MTTALAYLNVDQKYLISIVADSKTKIPFDNHLTVENVLTNYVDLSGAVKLANQKDNMDQNC